MVLRLHTYVIQQPTRSEGINEFGIGILNTALMVGFDEIEKKIVKKAGKPSKDGARIRRALTSRTLKQAVESAALGGVKGIVLWQIQ